MNVFESAERILLGLAGTVTEAAGTILGDSRVVAGGKVLSAGADKVERSMRAGAAPAKGTAGGSADSGAKVKGITLPSDASVDRVAAALRPRPKTTTMEETTLEAPAAKRTYQEVSRDAVEEALRPETVEMEETTLEAPAAKRSYDAVQEFDVSDAGDGPAEDFDVSDAGDGPAEDFGGDDWTSLVSA